MWAKRVLLALKTLMFPQEHLGMNQESFVCDLFLAKYHCVNNSNMRGKLKRSEKNRQ